MNNSRDFYYSVDSFDAFTNLVDEKHYKSVPGDWFVIITDVKGSTKAIEAGRYRDVNTVGAATIITIQNAVGDFEFPFVFGGDGATILIPEIYLASVSKALLALKELSQSKFNLELRTGCVKVQNVLDRGGLIEVAKYELIKGKSIALFRGGGLTLAEELIKSDEGKYEITGEISEANLVGMSCRWQPIKSKRGQTLSILVQARISSNTYKEILNFLNKTIKGKLGSANPVNMDNLQYKSFQDCFRDEKRYEVSIFSKKFGARLVDLFIAYVIFFIKVPLRSFNRLGYMKSMQTHADYRKFDDMLRMVLDCSSKEIEKIQVYLEQLYREGKIFYGLHESDEALMTCYVPSTKDGDHIHFIDGGDGGYAMAAKQLKKQIKENA